MATIERFLPELKPKKDSQIRRHKSRSGIEPRSQVGKKRGVNSRRWLGLILVALSLLGGYLSVVRADQRSEVLSLKNDLSAGQVITADDLTYLQAAIPDGLYASRFDQVVGQAVGTDVRAGELLPLSLLSEQVSKDLVAVPVRVINLPPVTRGERVDMWAQGTLIAQGLPVAHIVKEATTMVVTLEVDHRVTPAVVAALSTEITLVKSS